MRWFITICCLIFFSHLLSAQNNDTTVNVPLVPLLEWQVGDAIDVVAFHPSEYQLATGGRDNAVRLWDTTSGNETTILAGHSDWITSLAYSPDGTVLASGGRDNNIWLWNIDTGTSLRLIEDHQAEIKAMTFTPDGSYFISGDLNGIIRFEPVGNPSATQLFENFGGGVWSLAMSPDGRTIAIGSNDGSIWMIGIWDSEGAWVTPLSGHQTPVTTLTWSPDGTQLLSGEQNGHIYLWDVTDVKLGEDNVTSTMFEGHRAPVTAVDFTTNDELLVSSALDGSIRLWDTTNNDLLTIAYQKLDPLTDLTLDSTGTLSASTSPNGNIKLWSLEDNILDAVIEEFRPVVVRVQPATNPQTTTNAVVFATATPDLPPPPTPQALNLPATDEPARLTIPSINMNVVIKTFPLAGGTWAIDPYEPLVGHLQGTSWINGNGNVGLAGHSVYPDGRAGIFNSLYGVNIGDEIIVQDDGIVRRYQVSDIRVVDYRDISVVYPSAGNRVTLITCDIPSFEEQTGLYGERLVVIADAVN